MTIWQFDGTIQTTINQMIMIEIVKLPNCHVKICDDADSSSRGRTKEGMGREWVR